MPDITRVILKSDGIDKNMLKCSRCKDPIQGPHAVCKYADPSIHINAQCPCALHLPCLEAAKEDPKILLRCGCHHSHIDSFTQVEHPNAMEDDDVFIVDAMEDEDVYIVQVIPAPAQNTSTINLFDKYGDLTIITVAHGVIKIGQHDKQNVMDWEERKQILVKYTNYGQEPYIYIPYKDDEEETGNGWYIPSSSSEKMRCFFDALVRDGKLVPRNYRGPYCGTLYIATR